MNKVSLRVNVGETVAFVGHSGCGKSTGTQLLQRFYDPESGEILLDGQDIKTLNVKSLRQQIGVVSQEPILFDMSIEENIRFGNPEVTLPEIQKAAKEANAHDFISSLPKVWDMMHIKFPIFEEIGKWGSQNYVKESQQTTIFV